MQPSLTLIHFNLLSMLSPLLLLHRSHISSSPQEFASSFHCRFAISPSGTAPIDMSSNLSIYCFPQFAGLVALLWSGVFFFCKIFGAKLTWFQESLLSFSVVSISLNSFGFSFACLNFIESSSVKSLRCGLTAIYSSNSFGSSHLHNLEQIKTNWIWFLLVLSGFQGWQYRNASPTPHERIIAMSLIVASF